MQAFDERAEQVLDIFRVEDGTVGLQHLKEAAHVGPFELLGQFHGELHGGDGALRSAPADCHLDGEAQVFHADPVDDDAPVVPFALGIPERGGRMVFGSFHGMAGI